MDPNANLAEMRRLVARILDNDIDALRLAELVQALDGWLSGGGFLPEAWKGSRNLTHTLTEELATDTDATLDAIHSAVCTATDVAVEPDDRLILADLAQAVADARSSWNGEIPASE